MLEIPKKRLSARTHDCKASLKNMNLAKIRADQEGELEKDMDEDIWNRVRE